MVSVVGRLALDVRVQKWAIIKRLYIFFDKLYKLYSY